MPTHRPLRTAVIGFGLSGRVFHTPLLAADPAYSLDAIVTAHPERSAQAAATHPGAAVLATADELFARADDFDVVVIGTPPATHHTLAAAAIGRGLNVVIDKPFVTRAADGRALIAAAARAGVELGVFQNRRWDADYLTVSRLVREGALGQVLVFESRFERWKPEGLRDWKDSAGIAGGGGVLFDLGTHVLDQALALFGPAESVHGETHRMGSGSAVIGGGGGGSGADAAADPAPASEASPGGSDADEDAFVSIRHASGVRSHLHVGLHAAVPGPRFRVLGSRAGYESWGLDGQEAALASGMDPRDPGYGVVPEDRWGRLGVPGATEAVPSERGAYPGFYRGFARAVHDGGPPPVDPADALATLAIIEDVHRANRR
jgi:predicted dehydrogenase